MINTIQISSDKINKVEEQIRQQSKPVDYKTLEYPIEIIVQKYLDGEDEDENEIFIPDYQREMVWSEENQSKFIESIFLGLPIPYILLLMFHQKLSQRILRDWKLLTGLNG